MPRHSALTGGRESRRIATPPSARSRVTSLTSRDSRSGGTRSLGTWHYLRWTAGDAATPRGHGHRRGGSPVRRFRSAGRSAERPALGGERPAPEELVSVACPRALRPLARDSATSEVGDDQGHDRDEVDLADQRLDRRQHASEVMSRSEVPVADRRLSDEAEVEKVRPRRDGDLREE